MTSDILRIHILEYYPNKGHQDVELNASRNTRTFARILVLSSHFCLKMLQDLGVHATLTKYYILLLTAAVKYFRSTTIGNSISNTNYFRSTTTWYNVLKTKQFQTATIGNSSSNTKYSDRRRSETTFQTRSISDRRRSETIFARNKIFPIVVDRKLKFQNLLHQTLELLFLNFFLCVFFKSNFTWRPKLDFFMRISKNI